MSVKLEHKHAEEEDEDGGDQGAHGEAGQEIIARGDEVHSLVEAGPETEASHEAVMEQPGGQQPRLTGDQAHHQQQTREQTCSEGSSENVTSDDDDTNLIQKNLIVNLFW